jgi:hypothetical protein
MVFSRQCLRGVTKGTFLDKREQSVVSKKKNPQTGPIPPPISFSTEPGSAFPQVATGGQQGACVKIPKWARERDAQPFGTRLSV